MIKTTWIGIAVALLMPAISVAKTTGTEDLLNQQNRPWQPEAPVVQIPLWPRGHAIASPATPGEEVFGTTKEHIAGRPITMVEHVSVPTMTRDGKDDGVTLTMADTAGHPRIVMKVAADGSPSLKMLDAKGKVVGQMVPAS